MREQPHERLLQELLVLPEDLVYQLEPDLLQLVARVCREASNDVPFSSHTRSRGVG